MKRRTPVKEAPVHRNNVSMFHATRAVRVAAIVLLMGATACGRSSLDDTRGCLILGWGKRALKEDTVRVEFGVDELLNVTPDQIVYAWSTVAELSDGPRRVLRMSKGTATEAPYILYVEPGGPAEGGVFIDAGIHACDSLSGAVRP